MTLNDSVIGQTYRLIWLNGDEQRHVTAGTIVAVDAEEVTVETEAGKQTIRLVDVDDAAPAPALRIRAATVVDLLDPETRRRFKVAIWAAGPGAELAPVTPVTEVAIVRDCPAEVRWVVVDSAVERDGEVVWVADNCEKIADPAFPIVLGEVV